MSHNLLRELPSSLGRLACLQKLNLSHNKLGCLPESVGQLTRTLAASAAVAGDWLAAAC